MFKIKSLVSTIVLITLTLSSVSATYTTTNTNNWYNDPIIDSSLNFTAVRDWYKIKMDWSTYNKSNFKYYKVIRSETLENPVYPDNWYIKAIWNNDTSEATYENKSSKSAIYRVCVITTDMNRYCSKTVKLAWYNAPEKTQYDYEKKTTYVKKTTYENKYGISSTLAKRADKLVAQFAIKIEEKLNTDSDKLNAYETIIWKLENLSEKKESLKNLIDYIVNQLKAKMWKYNSDFDEIEEIFKDIQ